MTGERNEDVREPESVSDRDIVLSHFFGNIILYLQSNRTLNVNFLTVSLFFCFRGVRGGNIVED